MLDELLLCAPPAIAGLLLGLRLGARFSRWAVAALGVGIVVLLGLLAAFGETQGWFFEPTIMAAAALGGFLGPAIVPHLLNKMIVSGISAPIITFGVFYAGAMIACGVWGGCL